MQRIDLLNVDSFVRLKEVGKPRTFYKRVFLEGGNLDENAIEQRAQALVNEVGVSGVEKALDNMKMDYVKDALYVPFGIEPIVGYLQAKETENPYWASRPWVWMFSPSMIPKKPGRSLRGSQRKTLQ